MKRIACLSQKGGVGKSSLTRLLATEFLLADYFVKVVDMDIRQTTTAEWASRRKEMELPTVPVVVAASPREALAIDGADVVVIDGKPFSDTHALELAKSVDLILLPTATSLDDLNPQIILANDMVAGGVPRENIMFVVYGFITSGAGGAEVEAVREYIGKAGYQVARTAIGTRLSYINALNAGLSLSEVQHKGCKRVAQQLVEDVFQKVFP